MTTLSELIGVARARLPSALLEIKYLHPMLTLIFTSADFEACDEFERRESFLALTGLSKQALDSAERYASFSLRLLTPEQRKGLSRSLDKPTSGTHWLENFGLSKNRAIVTQSDLFTPKVIHFYGYKGGQARSTVLITLAKALAEDGFRILLIDADIEAPSLDSMLGVSVDRPEATLMGACGWADTIEPIRVYSTGLESGYIELLGCRPTPSAYDLDFAAFALRVSIDPNLLEFAANKIRTDTFSTGYDCILIDHRTGLTPSVLPIMRSLPGAVVIAVRLDGLSAKASLIYESLLSFYPEAPGAYISFSLDPEKESHERARAKHSQAVEALLNQLSDAIRVGAENTEEVIASEELERFWIPWFHDRAFLSNTSPSLSAISKDNLSAIRQLREVLNVGDAKHEKKAAIEPPPFQTNLQNILSLSGSRDSGGFIETPELSQLLQPNSPTTYIFGRKGTGKTRLFREMASRKAGEPLLTASDFPDGGLPSSSAIFKALINALGDDFEKIWWVILAAAIVGGKDQNKESIQNTIRSWLDVNDGALAKHSNPLEVARLVAKETSRRFFLIDGVETAVPPAKLRSFVSALFQLLSTVQADPGFSSKIIIRLFLRTDLQVTAVENIEQQTDGRKIQLAWRGDAIFNFVLARIALLPWFESNFPSACKKINAKSARLRTGQVPEEEYREILLDIFPQKLRRNNLQTITFFKTYFSDAAGDDEAKASFYPRLFERFLDFIANPSQIEAGFSAKQIEDDRVNHSLVIAAHSAATKDFMNEVESELKSLLNLDADESKNAELVRRLRQSFDGLQTPFSLDDYLVPTLHERLPDIDASLIRQAMVRMKEYGLFEDRLGHPGEWRIGRLYKSALNMKYVRKFNLPNR
jgi:Mrp family chromosome partitioning ATPase